MTSILLALRRILEHLVKLTTAARCTKEPSIAHVICECGAESTVCQIISKSGTIPTSSRITRFVLAPSGRQLLCSRSVQNSITAASLKLKTLLGHIRPRDLLRSARSSGKSSVDCSPSLITSVRYLVRWREPTDREAVNSGFGGENFTERCFAVSASPSATFEAAPAFSTIGALAGVQSGQFNDHQSPFGLIRSTYTTSIFAPSSPSLV